MADAILNNAVPSPGSDAVDKLTATLERLVQAIGGGSSGGKGGSSSKPENAEADKARRAELARWKLEEQIHKQTYDALSRLNRARQSYEKKLLADNLKIINDRARAERNLQAQRSRSLIAEQKSLESAEKMAKKMQQQAAASLARQRSAALDAQAKADERAEIAAGRKREQSKSSLDKQRSREYTKQLDATDRAANRLAKLLERLGDKIANGGVLSAADQRKLQRADPNQEEWLARSWLSDDSDANAKAKEAAKKKKVADTDANRAADKLAKLLNSIADRLANGGLARASDYRKLIRAGASPQDLQNVSASSTTNEQLRNQGEALKKANKDAEAKQAAIDDRVKREKAFYNKMQRREARGLGFTEGNLARAQELNMPGLARHIAAKIDQSSQAAKDKATQKRVEDFEIQQHNMQVDNDRRAKAKAEREAAKANAPTKQGGSFFGGFTRNMVIGRLYAAANAALAPLEAFGTGIGSHWIKAWTSLTSAAFNTGKALSYASGMGKAAAEFENNINAFSERMKKYSALKEMGTDVGGRAAAGMVRGSAGLASGVAGAVGGALDNPLTGFTHIIDMIGNAVGMADPGIMSRYNMVLRDLTATIGQGLAPVVSMITKLMKEFGDYLQPVVQEFMPDIKKVMQELFDAIKPLIPLFIVELKNTIKDITESLKEIGAGGELNSGKMVRKIAGVDESSYQYMNAGGAFLGGVMNPFGIFGSGEGGGGAGGGGNLGGGPLGGIAGIMNQMAGLRKGNIAGAAVAQNATIGSGSDLARKASQEAFIASSAKGNIDPAQQLFQQAAQGAINFFQAAFKPKPAANGNGQAGIAPGKGEGAMEFGAGQGQFQKVARSFLSGVINPFGVFG